MRLFTLKAVIRDTALCKRKKKKPTFLKKNLRIYQLDSLPHNDLFVHSTAGLYFRFDTEIHNRIYKQHVLYVGI